MILLIAAVLCFSSIHAQESSATNDAENAPRSPSSKFVESNRSFSYKTGKIDLNSEVELEVPAGFKFMEREDAEYVVYDLWHNRVANNCLLGLLVKSDFDVMTDDRWVIQVTVDRSGYAKDEGADKIDYDQRMLEMKSLEAEENEIRKEEGLSAMHLINWVGKPYYDKTAKTLHSAVIWSDENTEDTILNFDIRFFGRKGFVNLCAVGTLSELNDIQRNIAHLSQIVRYKPGHTYADYVPHGDIESVYNVGGFISRNTNSEPSPYLFFVLYYGFGAFVLYRGFKAVFLRVRNKKKYYGKKSP